jgi:hypothetical protein
MASPWNKGSPLPSWCVVFESEEKARAREQDPRRQEGLQAARAVMADIFEGPPEFTDLIVVDEWTDATA